MSFANKIILNGETLIDLTEDNVTEEDVREGITFHKADGSRVTGKYVASSNGAGVSGSGVIEVETLPTENIDKDAIYYISGKLKDVGVMFFGGLISFAEGESEGIYLHAIPTEDFNNISISDMENTPVHLYFIHDNPTDIFMYVDNGGDTPTRMTLGEGMGIAQYGCTYKGKVNDISEIPEEIGYYAVISSGYYKYFDLDFKDIVISGNSASSMGISPMSKYIVDTKPTDDIHESSISEPYDWHFYYVTDDNDIYLYSDFDEDGTPEWKTVGEYSNNGSTFGGEVSKVNDATDTTKYYAVVVREGFQELIPESQIIIPVPTSEERTVTPTTSVQEITPYDSDYLSKVTVNAIPSNYAAVSGTLTITENGTHDVKSYESATVNVSSTCIVNSVSDLPSDAVDGSIAFVLGGE